MAKKFQKGSLKVCMDVLGKEKQATQAVSGVIENATDVQMMAFGKEIALLADNTVTFDAVEHTVINRITE